VELGEGFFLVAGDDGPVFRESFAEAIGGGHVRVGNMVNELPNGPATCTIGCVELVFVEMAKRFAEQRGHLSKSLNGEAQIFRRDGFGRDKVADRIAGIVRFSHEVTVAPDDELLV